ncbi:MAG: class II aldolase/adducin family protein [Betaproteobacteria bacterium]|nr:class II aldolase/adducin family protein [Betaproteobacteria bacterium]
MRVPGADDQFLINPYGMLFEEITASSLIKVNTAGDKLSESPYEVNRTRSRGRSSITPPSRAARSITPAAPRAAGCCGTRCCASWTVRIPAIAARCGVTGDP